jgi:hypothetical protein
MAVMAGLVVVEPEGLFPEVTSILPTAMVILGLVAVGRSLLIEDVWF